VADSLLALSQRKALFSDHPTNQGKKQVMVVDDEPVAHVVVSMLLVPAERFEVLHAFSGEEALAMLDALPLQPDLMLVEALLPGMDGYEVSPSKMPYCVVERQRGGFHEWPRVYSVVWLGSGQEILLCGLLCCGVYK